MATSVQQYPGNLKVSVYNGFIVIDAKDQISITSQFGYIRTEAGLYITNEATGGYLRNIASQEVLIRSNLSYVEVDANDYIRLTSNSNYIQLNAAQYARISAGDYVELKPQSYLKFDVTTYHQSQIGDYSVSVIGGYQTVDVAQYIEQSAGNYYKISALGGRITLEANSFVEIDAQQQVTITSQGSFINLTAVSVIGTDAQEIELGANDTQDVIPNAKFKKDLFVRDSTTYDIGASGETWRGLHIETIDSYDQGNVQNPYFRVFDPNDVYGAAIGNAGQIAIANAQRASAPVYFRGGVGIAKDLNVGGFIYGRIETANTSLSINVTATNIDQVFYNTFAVSTGNQFLFIDSTGLQGGYTYNPSRGLLTVERGRVVATDQSVSTTTGAFTVTGGVGIGKDVYIGGNILPGTANTSSIGLQDLEWATGFINNLYSEFIGNTNTNIIMQPDITANKGRVDIFGDIRVRGKDPVGTAPVVRNTLYVTMDGNDTNDGRAMDASRACRTISGAVKSPYYQEGTQILVSAGFYLEDNPIRMKPYTSIRGSDIRTTFIEPINKTQDLFHVESGCYLNYMTFLNGRSGLLEGPYEQGFNRGAYCTAFPPLEGDDRIDLFHSPYIQNCTNQSGPWLKDGTMFIPNSTVQIPRAVGTGTWEANTTTIVVKANTGTIAKGMSINAGNQNPGFFDARTLMLANKAFIQEQVVAFVDQTFNSGNFVYDQIKCARDTGLILESIAIDMLQDSTSESIFAGLQYWRQSGYVDAIGSQFTATINSIGYLATLAVTTASNAGGGAQGSIVNQRFQNILTILNTSTATLANGSFSEWITNSIVSNGTATNNVNTVLAYNALLAAKNSLKEGVISYITSNFPTLVYNSSTCRRDVGFIIDSVAFDLLHGGNKQSIKSGVYYFGYTSTISEINTGSSNITNEIPQTTAAYRFLKGIVSNVVQGIPVPTKYQNSILQTIAGYNSGTIHQAEDLSDRIDIITGIIRNGPSDYAETGKRIPISLETNTTTQVSNAYNLLQANKNFIVAETIAYINSTSNYFEYNREKCRRDVGILVENISYDATFGGNEKAVESGLAYFDGVISKISGQEVQTISAIDYLNSLAQKIIRNQTCTNLLGFTATHVQVINTALTGGAVSSDTIDYLFDIVTTIIDNGPTAAPTIYNSPGPDSAFVSAQTLIQSNRAFIQQDTINYVNNVLLPTLYPGYFSYSEIKCRRDTGLIIDSIAIDLLYPTAARSQSTFAGLQYWNQDAYVGAIADQLNPTVDAIKYLKDLARKIVLCITPSDDLVNRYQTAIPQVTNLEPGTDNEVTILNARFDELIEIVNGNKSGWTNRIIPNGKTNSLLNYKNAYNLLIANRAYLGAEVNAYVQATNFGFTYDTAKCARDVGYLTEAVGFDMLHGGNRQTVQNGLYYYGFTSTTNIYNETTQTVAAFNTLSYIISQVVLNTPVNRRQFKKVQTFFTTTATISEVNFINTTVNTITSIILNGPSVAALPAGVAMTASNSASVITAYDLIYANKDFIIEEVISFIDQTYNAGRFNYDEAKCFRDVGLILDAVTQDVILGGNSKSIEAGLAYWSGGYNSVGDQITTTTMAINHARDMAITVAKNQIFTATTGTLLTQNIIPFFQYGDEYGPQEAIRRNFNIITTIIEKGPLYAPPTYAGGGLFSLVGINGADVKIAPKVISVSTITTGTYRIGLDIPTIGFGVNSTLYFGDTQIFPLRDKEVDEQSFEYAGNTSTWALRKIDPVGGMGGSLVDGGVISDRSPIQSFVYDAFTQLTQGGRGVHIIRDGYAQLVSVFTIFASKGVEVESGGIASIVNSNANFGDICLQAKGFGKRKFTGHIYNPSFKSYPESPNLIGGEYLNQYYPSGFWPNNAQVMVFLPDLDDRPHISLVMEVIPPETVRDYTGELVAQVNEQGFPGFLNASPTTSTLSTGSITISGIDTTNIFVGNRVYARDQFGRSTSSNIDVNGDWIPYVDDETFVTGLEYQTVTLSKPLLSGGADPDNTALSINDNYFDLYFCGNAYYTVLSSEVGSNPQYAGTGTTLIPDGENILSAISLGLPVGQINEHIATLNYLNTITNRVISNLPVTSLQTGTSTTTQYINLLVQGGGEATSFIDLRFDDSINIIGAANLTAAEAVVRPSLRTTSGAPVQGAGSAVSLIEQNIEFLADEVSAFVRNNYFSTNFVTLSQADKDKIFYKCQRDTKIILQRLIYDIETGGRYNMVMVGLSYWRRQGTYHIVSLGEAVTRTDLFPDGATVNFYQRSYMSASGYVFEYVGAGIDYGALPQRGVADPQQGREVVQLNAGKVFFTSTDQNGDFRIGPGLVISQATGVLSGRTFTRSLFANLTPFILAIEAGGG